MMMNQTLIPRNTRFFEQVLAVLERHSGEPGVEHAKLYIGAARSNYEYKDNKSMDYLLKSLILALHYLWNDAASDALGQEMREAVQAYYDSIFGGPGFEEMARKYVESGGRIYTVEEILAERNS